MGALAHHNICHNGRIWGSLKYKLQRRRKVIGDCEEGEATKGGGSLGKGLRHRGCLTRALRTWE